MSVDFDSCLRIPDYVLISDLDGESVILSLKAETYFGLDAIGTRMWAAVTKAPSVRQAYDTLLGEFDVQPEELREHFVEILNNLLANELLEVRQP